MATWLLFFKDECLSFTDNIQIVPWCPELSGIFNWQEALAQVVFLETTRIKKLRVLIFLQSAPYNHYTFCTGSFEFRAVSGILYVFNRFSNIFICFDFCETGLRVYIDSNGHIPSTNRSSLGLYLSSAARLLPSAVFIARVRYRGLS